MQKKIGYLGLGLTIIVLMYAIIAINLPADIKLGVISLRALFFYYSYTLVAVAAITYVLVVEKLEKHDEKLVQN